MLRPDESHSSVSSAENAIRSETCSPSTSMTRSSCPLLSRNAVPVCGWIRRRLVSITLVSSVEMHGTGPLARDRPPGVLSRFRMRPVVGEHRVYRPMKLRVPLTNRVAQMIEALLLAQPFELKVVVEHERRPGKATRPARVRRRQADDEEGVAAKAHREPRVLRI